MEGLHFEITGDNGNFLRKLAEVENGVRQTSRQIEQSGLGIEELFSRMTKAAAAFGAGFSAKQLISNIVQVRGEFQQLEVAFKTMLGSAEKADDLMRQLVKTAAITPFDLQGVANGAKQLLAYGLASDKVNETLIRLGDIAAGLSLPLNDIVYLYGTTMTQGRLYTHDLNQFLGRGIPLADELAKQFGVTGDKVKELVEAGKVGFPEVQKAIEAMTGEGGKFGGLMEAQSKTITGQISNIEDAISGMFNELGKQSEGIINTALSGVSYLVENYEKVGKAIAELVAAYGVYKAALMTMTALHKAEMMVLRQAVVEKRMAAAAGITLSNSEAVAAARTKMLSIAQQNLVKSLKAAKAAMLGNPYAVAAAAVAALCLGMYKLITYQTESEKAEARLGQAMAESQSAAMSEQRELARLKGELSALEKGSDDYKAVKDKIISQYGKYYDGLDAEIEKVGLTEEAYKRLTDAIRQSYNTRAYDKYIKEEQDNLDEIRTKNLEKLQNKLLKQLGDEKGTTAYTSLYRALSEGDEGKLRKAMGDISKGITDKNRFANKDVFDIERYIKGIQEAERLFSRMDEKARTRFGIGDGASKGGAVKGSDVVAPDFDAQVKSARESVAGLRGELNDLRKGKAPEGSGKDFDFASAIADKEKELKAAQEKLNTLTGVGKGTSGRRAGDAKKAADERKKAQEKLGEELLALERQNQQDDINLKEEGTKKKLAQIKLDFTKQEDAIKKQAEEWKKANKEAGVTDVNGAGLTKEQQDAIDKANKLNADARKKAESEVYRSEAEAMRDYLKEYGTFQQQKLAIAEEYAEKIRNAQTEGEKLSLEKELQEKLSSINLSEFKQNFNWDAVFGNLSLYSAAKLKELRAQLKKLLETDTSLSVTDKTSLIEQYNKLGDAIIRDEEALGGLFSFRSEQQNQIRLLQEEYDLRKKIYDNLVEERDTIRDRHTSDMISLQSFMSARGLGTDTSNMDVTKIISSLDGSDKEKFQSLFNAFNKSGSELSNVTSQVNKAGASMNNASVALKGAGNSAAGTIAMIDTIIHGINDNVQAANELMQILEVDDTKFGKGFDSFAKSSQYATDAWESLKSGNVMGVAAGVAGSIKELGNAIGTWFGLGADWSEYNRMVEEYNKLNEIWDELIDKKQKYIDISYGDESRKVGQEVDDLLNKRMGANVELGIELLNSGSSAGSHSIGVRQRKGMSDKGWKELRKAAADIGFNYNSVADGRMTGLFDLTAKQLEQLKEQAPSFWMKLDENVQKYLDTIIECGDAIEENKEKMKETLTGVSFDSFYDNFVSLLSDMDKSSEDFADSFGDYLRNALLQNLLANKYKQRIQGLYDTWVAMSDSNGDNIFDLTSEEAEYLKRMQQTLAEQIIAERDAMAEAFGWDEEEERTATAKGIAQASQDSVDELNGRFTAIQGHTYSISESMLSLVELQRANLPLLQNLSYLAPIEENTSFCRHLAGMDADLHAVRNAIVEMQQRGITVK